MSKIEVERSNLIGVPVEEVFATVRDFKSWPLWSPWLCTQPDCQLDFADDNSSYRWEGDVVGAGEMKVVAEKKNEYIDYELTQQKPWKSVSQVRFLFKPEGDRTRTTWELKSKLPLHLFWMRGMTSAAIGMDYQRGLAMLKALMKNGAVPSALDFMGATGFEGLSYVGIQTSCRIADVAEKMEADMLKIKKWVQDQHITPAGKPLSIYHKWSPTQGSTTYTLGFPVEKVPGWLPENFVSGKIPACQVQRFRHTGPYLYLSNAWSTGMAHLRAKKWHPLRSVHPFEIYENDPTEVSAEELVTTVHFPMKAVKG